MNFKKPLIALDLSDESPAILNYISENVFDKSDDLSLLTVVSEWTVPPYILETLPNPVLIKDYQKRMVADATRKLDDISSELGKDKNFSKHVVSSALSSAEEICNFAKNGSYDLIVMGSHGAGAISNLFIGSTVQRTLRLASCPVLVITKECYSCPSSVHAQSSSVEECSGCGQCHTSSTPSAIQPFVRKRE